MKLPSINYLYSQARDAFLRFPITIISSVLGMFVALYMIEYHDDIDNFFPFINLLLCFALGIPLFFGVKMYAEKSINSRQTQWILRSTGLLFLIVLYFTLPNEEHTTNTALPYIRYTIYNICIHLMVSFAPFIMSLELNGFWQYNKSLFLRFLTSLLFSAFIYGGLMIAMGALHILFDIKFEEETYFEIYVIIIGLFNTWFFLSGAPADFLKLDESKEYPKGLRIFTQYVLMPLLVLYFLILYSYTGKIIMNWDWPKGIVSYMISAISVLGIFQILLFHPYGFTKGNEWIRKASKGYYFMMLPMIVVLFFAISIRIGDYGITINRYIIVLLGIWLSFISAYFITGKTNIKMIPISLSIIIFMTSFGPWGMFAVSERSQAGRLEKILTEAAFLKEGKIVDEEEILIDPKYGEGRLFTEYSEVNDQLISDSVHNEIKSILDYLDDFHGFNAIAPWFEQNVDSIVVARNVIDDRWNNINHAKIYMEALGLSYKYFYKKMDKNYYYFNVENSKINNISGYDIEIDFNESAYNYSPFKADYKIANEDISIYIDFTYNHDFYIIYDNKKVNFDLDSLLNTLILKYNTGGNNPIRKVEMQIESSNKNKVAKVNLENITCFITGENESLNISNISGKIFLKIKE